jgi:D-alanine-D-alanine ligase
VFPVLHGTLGEDGAVQGLLEVAGIPYVGAGILGSAVGMDKDVMKRLLRDAGIPVTPFQTVRRVRFDANPLEVCRELAALGFPLFVKPANAGSSVGITKVRRAEDIEPAVRHAFEFDTKVLGEAGVDGREIELAVLGGRIPTVSIAGEIVVEHPDGFYSYDAKYIDEKGVRFDLPARLSAGQLRDAQALALRTFEVLECEGLARVDLFLTGDGSERDQHTAGIHGDFDVSEALGAVGPAAAGTRLAAHRSRARSGETARDVAALGRAGRHLTTRSPTCSDYWSSD